MKPAFKLAFFALVALVVYLFSSGGGHRARTYWQAPPVSPPPARPSQPAVSTQTIPAGDEYQQLLSIWQKREGLEDWKITLRVVRQSELPRGSDGDIDWSQQPGAAVIRILCASDMASIYGWWPSELHRENELVIVHELMHLLLRPLGDRNWSRGEEARYEAVTEALAKMLLNRRVPGGVPEAQYINREINYGPWKPAPEAKKQVMLQLIRAIHATAEDDALALLARN